MVKLNSSKQSKTYSMFTTDTKPTLYVEDGDILEVLDDTTKQVVEIWRFHVSEWYKY